MELCRIGGGDLEGTISRPRPWSRQRLPAWGGAALLVAAAFAIRAMWFGDPVIHVDEQWYLLVGDRMLHGAVPFVDLWDRKPVGLFLLYAGIRLLGGAGIVQYQVVATLFAAATAISVARMAGRIATPRAGLVAGIVYLLGIGLLLGQGGQSPVFYNLPVALAAEATLGAVTGAAVPARIARLGAVAMALVGIAIQIKYTALFEGLFFGLALMGAMWRASGRLLPLAGAAALWVAIALAPTLAALLVYAGRGETGAFLFANFLSIGLRPGAPWQSLAKRIALISAPLLPLGLAIMIAARERRDRTWDAEAAARRFLLLWLGAAVAGVAAFGTFYAHYGLPLIAPFAVSAAPVFDIERRRIGRWWAIGLVAVGLLGAIVVHSVTVRRRGDAAYVAALVRPIVANLHGGCLYVYDGEPILYLLAHACAPTRYAFPDHLNDRLEAGAIGVDTGAEVRRILATRPAVIVDRVGLRHRRRRRRERLQGWGTNAATRSLVRSALATDYRLVAVLPLGGTPPRELRRVWARLPGR